MVIPGDIPYVAANGSIVAYIRLDALLLALSTDNVVKTAFALEKAGIRKEDMAGLDGDASTLMVRVRPISAEQIEKIVRIVKTQQTNQSRPLLWSMGFLNDCNEVGALLGGLAVSQAREHARAIAAAAHTHVGNVLGVVDAGGTVADAVCGVPKDAPMDDLARAAALPASRTRLFTPHLYATVKRSLTVAWRLSMPLNPAGRAWESLPQFQGRWWAAGVRPAFISDGKQADAGAILPGAFSPTVVRVYTPAWTLHALQASAYRHDVTDLSFGVPPIRPQVTLKEASASALQARLDGLLRFLSRIARPEGEKRTQSFLYSRSDCSAAVDRALYDATRNAIAQARGRIRYLQERASNTTGSVACAFTPNEDDAPLESSRLPTGEAIGDVVAGY